MSELAALIERVEALAGPDREVDREIGLLIGGWKATNDQCGAAFIIEGDRYPDHPGSEYPALTESLDAAVALVEKALPGCHWEVTTTGWKPGATIMWRPLTPWGSQGAYAPTPAIALILALLRAKAAHVTGGSVQEFRPRGTPGRPL